MSETTATTDLWDSFETFLAAEDLELDDLEVVGGGEGRIVRVVVDADGGVGVDRLAETSRALSRLLDDTDPFEASYTLEVTSPGLERKLTRPRHFAKSIGRDATVKTKIEIAGQRRHDGVIAAADDVSVTLDVAGESRRLNYDDIAQARTVFEWKRNPKPGKKSG
jgi:ribosome maturation factor RimP